MADSYPSAVIDALWLRICTRSIWIGDCFVWQGGTTRGYGHITVTDRQFKIRDTARVHRIAYQHANGPIPSHLTIDHVKARGCRFRACCNPAHLEAVPIRENIMRGDGLAVKNIAKTHCPRGHLLAGDNLRSDKMAIGKRLCRLCNNMLTSQRQKRQRDARKRAILEGA